MKQKKLLSLGIALLLGLAPLFAQKQNPISPIKSGDWFETAIRISNLTHTSDYRFDVRYEVVSKTQNGDLAFKVSIERMRLKYAGAAYDSYYPPYVENRKRNLTKQVYEIMADSHGKVSKLTQVSSASEASFSVIDVKAKSYTPNTVVSVDRFIPRDHIKQISETILNALILGEPIVKPVALNANGERNIANTVLKSASFKLLRNAVIKGKITNLTKADSLYEVHGELFRFNKDGSFTANILAGPNTRRRWLFGKLDENDEFDGFKTFSLLLEPLDTLIVKADALNFYNTVSFGGNAAAKAYLSKDLVAVVDNQWVNKSNYRSKSLNEFIAFQKQGQKDLDAVLNKYANRVSPEILNECRTDFKYVQAGTKLEYFFHQRKLKPTIAIDDFPKGFFLSIDTLPVNLSNQEGGLYNMWYLTWLASYQQTKLGLVKRNQYAFYTDFATAMASFEGYPLYASISESFKKELHKSDLENTERLKNYYEDFIANCGDTILTNRIKTLWAKARLWLPGNPSPVQKLLLKDGSTLDLAKFKRKPLVLIVNNHNSNVLKDYLDLIKKQKGSEVHFVIAQRSYDTEWAHEQKLKDLSNLTYVEVGDDSPVNFDLFHRQTKVFTFDADFRVIAGYLIDEYPGQVKVDKAEVHQVIQEMIKKAIDSSVMTKDQKASLINTIGWSIGSALLASIVIFLVYRARLASLRKKTVLKNKIKDLEIKAIRSQMNPHFMFNALNSIQSLINNDQYKEANIYLEKFALLMRRVLNNSEKSFVTLSDELDAITLYCELEQLRFNFKFEIEIAPEVNTELVEIPGMIIQPLVENSILHGLAQKGNAGRLNITIRCDVHFLKIVITDNGTGLKESIADGHNSFGLKLVKERLTLLSADGNVGNLHLSSNLGENETGATAVLTIPID